MTINTVSGAVTGPVTKRRKITPLYSDQKLPRLGHFFMNFIMSHKCLSWGRGVIYLVPGNQGSTVRNPQKQGEGHSRAFGDKTSTFSFLLPQWKLGRQKTEERTGVHWEKPGAPIPAPWLE